MRVDNTEHAEVPTLLLRGRTPESAQEAERWLLDGGQILVSGDDALLIADLLRRSLKGRVDLKMRMVGEEILLGPPPEPGGPAA